jgi:dedicator of cytokinesis protein 3
VIHPFRPAPSAPGTPTSPDKEPSKAAAYRNRFSWSGLNGSRGVDSLGDGKNAYEISLDVGDEFYAFEEYRCTVDEDGRGDVWYRGWVFAKTINKAY